MATLEELQAQLSILQSQMKTVVPQAPAPVGLLQAIGQALSEDDQVWLSDITRLRAIDSGLIKFFQTEKGKTAIKEFVTFYRGLS